MLILTPFKPSLSWKVRFILNHHFILRMEDAQVGLIIIMRFIVSTINPILNRQSLMVTQWLLRFALMYPLAFVCPYSEFFAWMELQTAWYIFSTNNMTHRLSLQAGPSTIWCQCPVWCHVTRPVLCNTSFWFID